MAPPKVRLHKTTGKLKSIPRPNSNGSTSQQPSPSTGTSSAPNGSTSDASATAEADRQFELELYWCIQQLETTLSLPHVRENNKKMEDTSKLINTLKSANQPIIRKRQIMRTTFGDYRGKMAAEELSLAVNPDSVRFQDGKKTVKYHFVKKSSILNESKDFRFNFPVASSYGAEEKDGAEATEKKQTPSHSCTYVPSDNSFRFNFAAASEKDA